MSKRFVLPRHLLGHLRLHPGVAIAAACLVVLVAGLIVVQLDSAERLASSRELELSRVEVLVDRVASAQWQALAEGQSDEATLAAFRDSWATTKRGLENLRVLAPSDPLLSLVVSAFDAYAADVDQELSLLSVGDRANAHMFESNAVAPTLALLSKAIASSRAAYQADAERAARDKAVNSAVTAIVAAGILLALLWLMRQSQARAERRFRALVQYSTDVFSILAPDGRILFESEAVHGTLGYPVADRIGTEVWALVHPDDQPLAHAHMQQLVASPGAESSIELRYRHADGEWRRIVATGKNLAADPAVGGIALSYRDVTEQRSLEDQLRRQALEDPLTGLSNRALLRDRMEHAVARCQRNPDGKGLAVFFLDLDDFKTVNDSLGHAAGDQLLTAVGQRLTGAVRAIDTVARLGGDEFAVLAEDIAPDMDPADLGRRLTNALLPAFQIGDTEIFVRASIGYAMAMPGEDGDILLRNADLAMYQAKADGKGGLRRYEPGLHDTAVARLALEHDMRRAIVNQEFVVEYQPIVALESDHIVGLEALLRWNHPTRGLMEPDAFIPLAEESGMIIDIGRWVLTESCRQLAEWDRAGVADSSLTLSVNLSVKQVHDPAVADDVARALRTSGLPANRLTLEITESVLVEDSEAVIGRLAAIRNLGVRIAIDDFGTGFSSLGYLSRFPVDVLKIDRSFVQRMAGEASDLAVVEAAIGLASSLGLETVAEGIERSGQIRKLRELGCRLGQGFLYSRPAAPEQIAEALRRDTIRRTRVARRAASRFRPSPARP